MCRPIRPASNGGSMHFITLTNHFSRKTWIYFLHEKYGAFYVIKQFKVFVENESGLYMKYLRTNRGGKFTSNAALIYAFFMASKIN